MIFVAFIALGLLLCFFIMYLFNSGRWEERTITKALQASSSKPVLTYSSKKDILGSTTLMIAAEAGLKSKWEAYRVLERFLLNIHPKMRKLRASPLELSVEVHFLEDNEKKGVLICDLRKYTQDATPIEFLYKESCVVAQDSPILIPTHSIRKERLLKELLRTIC